MHDAVRRHRGRRPPARRALLAAVLVAALGAACGPAGSTPRDAPASPVEGVVTDVDSRGLSQVRGFTLRLDDGTTLDFRIDGLENPGDFPPGHLGEHRQTSEPVRVFFRVTGGELVAYRLEDAGAAAVPEAGAT